MEAKLPSKVAVDLASLPQGKRYEDRYRGYLEIFEQIAMLPPSVQVTVTNAPASWLPLLWHLNCVCRSWRVAFGEHDAFILRGVLTNGLAFDRTMVEVLSNFRPETADALWKVDMQWAVPKGRVREYPRMGEFIVTTNGAYHRPEVKEYLARLAEYVPQKKKVVLVPCAADKPYPAPLHAAVRRIIPNDYYIMCATGVLGLVPEDLWPEMPHYDSGIPNEWRLYNIAIDYFTKHAHTDIIVYSDYYSVPLKHALERIGQPGRVTYAIEPMFYADYLDLTSEVNLDKLGYAVPRYAGDDYTHEAAPPGPEGDAVALAHLKG